MAGGFTGSTLYLKFGTTVLNTAYRAFTDTEEMKLVDQAAGADTVRTFLNTLKEGKVSIDLLDQASGSATWNALVAGASGSLEWGEAGTASGNPRHYATAIIQSRERKFQFEDVTMMTISVQLNSAITDTVY